MRCLLTGENIGGIPGPGRTPSVNPGRPRDTPKRTMYLILEYIAKERKSMEISIILRLVLGYIGGIPGPGGIPYVNPGRPKTP